MEQGEEKVIFEIEAACAHCGKINHVIVTKKCLTPAQQGEYKVDAHMDKPVNTQLEDFPDKEEKTKSTRKKHED
jgi:hypothetical protein